MPDDFDQIADVVDWLDACRRRDLDALLDLYAAEASLECQCDGSMVSEGRARLTSYWAPRVDGFVPNAFGLEEIQPTPDGVQLDYISHQGLPVRMIFSFTPEGKILRTTCAPVAQQIQQQPPSVQDRAV